MSGAHVPTGSWRLVGPSYLLDDSGAPAPRDTAPAIQKYETSDFAQAFLVEPRDFLPFDDCDRVFEPVDPTLADEDGTPKRRKQWALRQTETRKLFLATHKRFYLVVCELHCEKAGFPNSNPDEACEAGFVVRRRAPAPRLEWLDDAPWLLPAQAPTPPSGLWTALQQEQAAYGETATAVADPPPGPPAADAPRMEELLTLIARFPLTVAQGWVPSDQPKVGSWEPVEEEPQEVLEQVFPLYPLVPDPAAAPAHPGHGHAIWFGVVPTASGDHGLDGAPRFDDATKYEIRCFVRRHNPRCPRRRGARDCQGALTWSAPTEPFQLASQHDLVGTANHQVTVQMPDIPTLLAQAAQLPRDQLANVKFASSDQSSFELSPPGLPTSATLGGAMVCSMSIPLITIVAKFALNIFMPIVVNLLHLYPLLALEYCVPVGGSLPSFQLPQALTDAIAAISSDPSADLDLADPNLAAALQLALQAAFVGLLGSGGEAATGYLTNDTAVQLLKKLAAPVAAPPADTPAGVPGAACSALAGGTA